MKDSITWLAAFLALFAGSAAIAEAPAENPPTQPEELLATPPEGWQVLYRFANDQVRIVEFIPPDQEIDDWDKKLTFESYADELDRDPIDFLLLEAERFQKECKFGQHFNLFSGVENGYPSSARLLMCTQHKVTGRGAVRMMKAIQGEEYFYLIALTRRVPPFEINEPEMPREEIAGWASFLKMITLCREASADHPCPKREGSSVAPQ